MKTILFAIGNSARQDDGLGWAFGEAVENSGLFDGEIHFRYQLQVEDAELATSADRVIFVDAFKGDLPNGFQWEKLAATTDFEFTTHALSPQAVLFFCEDLYGKKPIGHWLLIGGQTWELGEGLSGQARSNLLRAFRFFEERWAKVNNNET